MKYSKCLILVVSVFLGSTRLLLAVEVLPATHKSQAPVRPTALPLVLAPPTTQPTATATAGAGTAANTLAETIRFGQQSARIGDQVVQNINAELLVNSTITQAGQIANESQSQIKRRQQRHLEVLEVVDGRVRRARVTFSMARTTTPAGAEAQSESLSESQSETESETESETRPETESDLKSNEKVKAESEVIQPVEGKSYLVTRQGEQLLVTDLKGNLPMQDEFKIVATSMQNLGLPNPLSQFLLGRTIRVGERLELPLEIAGQLMGLGDQLGKVKKFELELKAIQAIEGQQCAVFRATVEAGGTPDQPMNLFLFGKMTIQTATCRTVQSELSGPLTISKVERTPMGNYQFKARGNLQIAVQAKYDTARQ